jgi:hypothetical protein
LKVLKNFNAVSFRGAGYVDLVTAYYGKNAVVFVVEEVRIKFDGVVLSEAFRDVIFQFFGKVLVIRVEGHR